MPHHDEQERFRAFFSDAKKEPFAAVVCASDIHSVGFTVLTAAAIVRIAADKYQADRN